MPADLLELQLKLIEWEIQTINSTIRQMDEMAKSVKQWALTLWTAAVGTALATPRLAAYVALTAVIPLFFLIVEVSYRRVQRRFIWRSERIGEFVAHGGLEQAVNEGRISEFRLWDPSAVYTGNTDYREFISFRRVMGFGTVGVFYIGLAIVSLLVAVVHSGF